MRKVIATAPTRVDLAGGTLDLPPLYLFHPGALTVNAAIDQLATCEVTTRADTSIVLVSRDVGQREVYPSREALRLDTPLQLLARLVAFLHRRAASRSRRRALRHMVRDWAVHRRWSSPWPGH